MPYHTTIWDTALLDRWH